MKTIVLIFLIFSENLIYSQSIFFEENFDYATGTLTANTTNWIEDPTGSVDINVVSGNFSYSGYPSSGIGNKIVVDGGASGRSGVLRSFSPQSTDGSKVYASFILNVTSTTDMNINTSDGDRFFNFKVVGSSTFRSCVFVRQGSTSSNFQIGLGKLHTSTPIWHSTELNVNTNYLIVVSYVFQSGNDASRLWINPSLSGSEPIPDLEQTIGSDAANIGEVQFRQGSLSGDEEIDGLRLANDWSQAPLPVELSSFSASNSENGILLEWRTETEINNFGFEVEREKKEVRSETWEKIGFVYGNGNSNSPKEYRFNDENISAGSYSYRLKQIDNDGSFEYSEIVEIIIGSPDNFQLEQNYPNPFNPTTKINYSIPGVISNPSGRERNLNVLLKVYDVLGNEVATLVNEEIRPGRTAGNYSVEFNASDLPSGIYFYTLKSGTFVQTKKMLLLK